MLVNQGFCIFLTRNRNKYFYKNKLIFIFGSERYGGSEVGGPVVKGEIYITMGMWGKNYIYIKEKTFSFCG